MNSNPIVSFKQFITLIVILCSVGEIHAFSSTSNALFNINSNFGNFEQTPRHHHDRHDHQQSIKTRIRSSSITSSSRSRSSHHHMKRKRSSFDSTKEKNKDDPLFGLLATSFSAADMEASPTKNLEGMIKSVSDKATNAIPESLGKVLGAALLITSNTVGASMMVLPDLARGPGMVVTSAVIMAGYVINLFSGLLIAEVAINQYEASSCDVPSSFKEFADVNLKSNSAGTFVAIISVFVNMCVLSFDFVRGGQLMTENQQLGSILAPIFGADILSTPAAEHCGAAVAAAAIMTLVGTQRSDVLSKIASICCVTLFISFAGLVGPGLVSIHDPVAAFMAPGTFPIGSPDFSSSLSALIPIALMTLIYQNIIPTITKMLNYDRTQVVSAIALGSCFPMLMFISFCFTEIGSGGAASALSTGGIFMAGIRMSSLVGSAMAGTLSIGQELDIFLGSDKSAKKSNKSSPFNDDDVELLDVVGSEESCLTDGAKGHTLTMSSVALSAIPPLLAGIIFSGGEGFVGALSLSGSYGTPILYGFVPILLAFNQRYGSVNKEDEKVSLIEKEIDSSNHIAPGGMVSLGLLGVGSIALISNQLIADVSNLI